jgi:hypothetical protein
MRSRAERAPGARSGLQEVEVNVVYAIAAKVG